MQQRIHKSARRGWTLIELSAASFVTAAILVPTMSLMRQSMEYRRMIETRNTMTMLCISETERQMAAAAVDFSDAQTRGSFKAEGFPQIGFESLRSQKIADGGVSGQLMTISVVVWDDVNGDGRRDLDERSLALSTKSSKLENY